MTVADQGASPPARSVVLPWLRRGALVLVSLLVLDYLVLPQIAGTERAAKLLTSVDPVLVVVAVLLEAASLVSYSLLTRSLLPGHPSRFSWLIRSDLTGLGVSHLLPGGAATANALRFRLLLEGGAPAEDVGVGMAVEAVLSTAVLAALLWVTLVVSIPFFGPNRLYDSIAIVGALVIVAVVIGLLTLERSERPRTGFLPRLVRHAPHRFQPRLEKAVALASAQLRELLSDRGALGASAGWALGNWVLDAASLWVFLAAYGHLVNPIGLVVAYCLGNLLATLPISPGGLGVIEGVLVPSLVGFGTPKAIAVLGVVSWRLFEFWAPIPVAGVSYLSLKVSGRRSELA